MSYARWARVLFTKRNWLKLSDLDRLTSAGTATPKWGEAQKWAARCSQPGGSDLQAFFQPAFLEAAEGTMAIRPVLAPTMPIPARPLRARRGRDRGGRNRRQARTNEALHVAFTWICPLKRITGASGAKCLLQRDEFSEFGVTSASGVGSKKRAAQRMSPCRRPPVSTFAARFTAFAICRSILATAFMLIRSALSLPTFLPLPIFVAATFLDCFCTNSSG